MILKNKIHYTIIIVQIILILPTINALNQKCEAGYHGQGVCVDKSQCKMLDKQVGSAKSYPGFCEDDPVNIQCCVKTVTTLQSGTKLKYKGTCKNINICPTSSFNRYINQCPGNNDVKLCEPKNVCNNNYGICIPSNLCDDKLNDNKTGSNECTNSNICCSRKYFFAVGFKENIYINNRNEGVIDQLHKLDYSKLNLSTNDFLYHGGTRKLYDKVLLDILENDGTNFRHIDFLAAKHAGFYIGTIEEGKIFEFDINGWNTTEYIMGNDRFKQKPTEKNDWDWISLNLTGYTYISPDSLEQSLIEYRENSRYFTNESFHHICNNSFDFVHWCITILKHEGGKRLVPNHIINIPEKPYDFKTDYFNKNIQRVILLESVNDVSYKDFAIGGGYGYFESFSNTIKKYFRNEYHQYNDHFEFMYKNKGDITCVPYIGFYSNIEDTNIVTLSVKTYILDKILPKLKNICRDTEPSTKTYISNLEDAISHYRGNSGKTVPASSCLIKQLIDSSRFFSMKTDLRENISFKITDDKIKNKEVISASPGSYRGLWYLTLGSYKLNIDYSFIPIKGYNNVNIHYYGYDPWDFESYGKDGWWYAFLDILEHEIPKECAGKGTPFNITYDFHDVLVVPDYRTYFSYQPYIPLYKRSNSCSYELEDSVENFLTSLHYPFYPFINDTFHPAIDDEPQSDIDTISDNNLNSDENSQEQNEEKEDSNKIWILVGLGAIWNIIVYIICCRCC